MSVHHEAQEHSRAAQARQQQQQQQASLQQQAVLQQQPNLAQQQHQQRAVLQQQQQTSMQQAALLQQQQATIQQQQANAQVKQLLGSRQPSVHVDTFQNKKFFPADPLAIPRGAEITQIQKTDSNPLPSSTNLIGVQGATKHDFSQFTNSNVPGVNLDL